MKYPYKYYNAYLANEQKWRRNKKKAGRTLQGQTWYEYPDIVQQKLLV